MKIWSVDETNAVVYTIATFREQASGGSNRVSAFFCSAEVGSHTAIGIRISM